MSWGGGGGYQSHDCNNLHRLAISQVRPFPASAEAACPHPVLPSNSLCSTCCQAPPGLYTSYPCTTGVACVVQSNTLSSVTQSVRFFWAILWRWLRYRRHVEYSNICKSRTDCDGSVCPLRQARLCSFSLMAEGCSMY